MEWRCRFQGMISGDDQAKISRDFSPNFAYLMVAGNSTTVKIE
jgi:hypothetical protein